MVVCKMWMLNIGGMWVEWRILVISYYVMSNGIDMV